MNRHDKRTILTGVKWRKKWTIAFKGIVNEIFDGASFGHAFKFYGVARKQPDSSMIDTEMYIMAQLSNGKEIGDEGIFYFSRKVINEAFKYGNYTFKDIPPEKARYLMENGVKATDNWIVAFIKQLLLGLKNIFSWTATH